MCSAGERASNQQPSAPEIRAELKGHYRATARYPVMVVNVTNHCNLACRHCFVYRAGNPNEASASLRAEMDAEAMLDTVARLRDRHGVAAVLWMGGEPMLKPRLLARGVRLFARNSIITNGTAPLIDFGPDVLYVVSLDGPEDLNDVIRGQGVFRRVISNLRRIPEGFGSRVQVQCVITKRNQHRLRELVDTVRTTRAGWMTFSFYVPRRNDSGPDTWATVDERGAAVREVMRLKSEYGGFIRNSTASLQLMLPPHAARITAACPARDHVLPLYLERDHFTTPFCCYGNDVDCHRCGAWVVFHLAARLGVPAEPARRRGR